jgi:hypothetical protein
MNYARYHPGICLHVIRQHSASSVWRKREVHTGFWWGGLREDDHLGDPGVDGRIILKCILKKWDVAWTELSWLRIGTRGGLL